jgi:ribosome-associated protein
MTVNDKVKIIYNALDDKKGIDIKIIDIRNISVLADYLVIAGGANKSQVQAMVDSVEEKLIKKNVHTNHVEGYNTANWILLDYSDIIVHVFNQEDRLFYDLERLWQDGKTVEIDELQ